MRRHRIRVLGAEDVPEVVDVLSESFFDYPVMRFVLGEVDDYAGRLGTLVHFFVMARVLRGETLLGVDGDGGLEAVALVSRPGSGESTPELVELREAVWRKLGAEARKRYEAFGAAAAPFEVSAPHIHLNMIGVRRRARGAGLGRRLVEAVHRRSLEDPGSEGVTLTTEDERNIPLYERLGYEVVGTATVAPELTTWGFYRPDPSYRAATVDDLDEVARVHVASQSALFEAIYPEESRPPARARDWPAWLENRPPFARKDCRKRIELAFKGSTLVGFAAARHGSNFEGYDADLTGLYILPDAQNQGIGRELMRRIGAWLESSGIRGMSIDVVAANPACRFYESLGAEVVGEWFDEEPCVTYGLRMALEG